MKVYIIWSGCYSDRGISGIFSSKKNADEWAKAKGMYRKPETDQYYVVGSGNETDYDLQEEEVDEELPKHYTLYTVNMKINGDVVLVECEKKYDSLCMTNHIYEIDKLTGKRYLRIVTIADGVEEAVKIAGELRTKLIATGKIDQVTRCWSVSGKRDVVWL